MRTLVIVFISAVLVAACMVSAWAQFDDEETGRIGVRVGIFMPSDSDLKDLDSSTWIGVGADWNRKVDKNGDVVEYLSLASYKTGDSYKKAAETPVTYNRVFRKRTSEEKANYFSVGLGANKLRLKAWRPKSGGGFKYVDDSHWVPMGTAAIGREFKKSYFVELQVNIVPSWQGLNWSGLTLCVGTRSAL
jgi:hypothetical protein